MGKIISVHSFRGGTGKSNVTANLAALLARLGKRVGIVDTDIQSPGIHVLFNLSPERFRYALNDYLWGKCRIEEAAYDVSGVLEGRRLKDAGSLHLIPGSMRTGEITRILRDGYDVGLLNSGFQELMERLELTHLLIDTHPGVNEETLLSIAISDILLLILRPDQQDYQGTAITVELARQLEVEQMFMLVNKAINPRDFTALKQRVESTYHVPVLGVLPLSGDVAILGSGDIFALTNPDHPVTSVLEAAAQRIDAA
ncbi:MinD/ParA family ATP-binding protein [Methylococcus capsulatus]|uniref:MinD/ParA family ATP-binding protein n=1 Tax=Methylococcus capsulatus TaxID=414 RepID=UPI001C530DEC|nr:MinD/ParA family protein [Methylococcus capsulatus]QXP88730.1 MinD/ParA family protein [Methylococcus capsulatus]QXP94238.1 MinD/ParA family protein [Methylococcus capsulatus]UQN11009.1 MinD/ParA family protein [Methylococcus capsulatus]